MIKFKLYNTEIQIIEGDITKIQSDAIVNAANASLMGGGGVDGAIHTAGGQDILNDCKKIIARVGSLPTGEAVITTAGKLPAKHVIHTVGPIWHGGHDNEDEKLKLCYIHSLEKTDNNGLRSVSFPAISTGVYKFPKERAAEIAMNSVNEYLTNKDSKIDTIKFVLFSKNDLQIYVKILDKLKLRDKL